MEETGERWEASISTATMIVSGVVSPHPEENFVLKE
jgi:hypothetical protein